MPGPVPGLVLGVPLAADVPELALEVVDVALDAPPVDLELGLAGASPGADATGLLGQPGAAPPQAGQAVPVLGQLDLGLALEARGVLGEDVEDHRGAVDGRPPEQLLQVELLGRGQLVVEDDGVAVGLEGDRASAPRPCPCRCSTSDPGRPGSAARGRRCRRPRCRPAARARPGTPRCPPAWPAGWSCRPGRSSPGMERSIRATGTPGGPRPRSDRPATPSHPDRSGRHPPACAR